MLVGSLSIKILSAEGLKPCDKNGKSDPYVNVDIHPATSVQNKAERKFKTSIKKKTLNPVYHETFGPVQVDGAEELEFVVKDWNFMSKSDVCGTARLRLGDVEALKSGLPQRQTVKLTEQGVLVLDIEFVDGQVLFGLDVTSVVIRERTSVPTIIARCTEAVERMGLCEPGLYRVPGRTADVRALKCMFIANPAANIPDAITDVNTVASLLKLYLRELPEPLFTNALHDELTKTAKVATIADSANLVHVLKKLPKAHLDTVVHLFGHLRAVLANAKTNKMTADNLATCFGPSLVTPSHSDAGANAMLSVGNDNVVIERLLSIPSVLERAIATDKDSDPQRVEAQRCHIPRSSLQYVAIETEYIKVVGGTEIPLADFDQFRDVCYELGCRATLADFVDARGDVGLPLSYGQFRVWVDRSRLAAFVYRSTRKRLGIVQAITYFKWFDKNFDGSIDASEWPELHADLRKHYKLPKDAMECLAELDANGDGCVELEEYLAWCLKEPVASTQRA